MAVTGQQETDRLFVMQIVCLLKKSGLSDVPAAAIKTVCLFVIILGPLFFTGCGRSAHTTLSGKSAPKATEMSQEDLRVALDDFEDYEVSTIKQTCDKLDELMPTVRIQKINLLHRARMKQAFSTMVAHGDQVGAFIETWGLSIRYTGYLREGEGKGIYGENQSIAVDGAVKIQSTIELVGKKLLKEDVLQTTRKQLIDFATLNPIKGTFSNTIVFAAAVKPGEPSPFDEIFNIPMSPFKAMGGVDRTATSIHEVHNSIDRFSGVAEGLPESTRWQLLLLALDIQDIESVKSFSENMSKISDSSVKLVDVAEKLPERIREQTSILAQEIDSRQANLQVTLEKAEKTVASLEQVFSQAGETLRIMEDTADGVNEAASNWESAATATGQTIQVIKDWSNEPRKENAPPAMTVSDYKSIIQEAAKTANEIKSLTTEIVGLTDHITWRLIQLVFTIFTLAFVYKFSIRRWIK